MKNIKDAEIKYYCNACGELHIYCADGSWLYVTSFTDIPFQLQEIYQRYWREGGSGMLNYIAEVDGQPGLLLIAEYRVDDDGDNVQENSAWLSEMDDLYRKEVHPYAEKMETLLRSIGTLKTQIGIFIGEYSGILESHEVAVFLPKALGHIRIVRALYAINELNRGVPQDQIDATLRSEGMKEYRLSDEIRNYTMAWPLRISEDKRINPLRIKLSRSQDRQSRTVHIYTRMDPAKVARKIEASAEKTRKQMVAAHVTMRDEFGYLSVSALNDVAPGAWEFVSPGADGAHRLICQIK